MIVYLIKANYEFVIYIVVAGLALWLVIFGDKHLNFHPIAVGGFSLWVFFHMIGGSLSINGIRLYDSIIIPLIGEPYNILKYDQAIHIFCYMVIALLLYGVAKSYFKKENWFTFLIVVLAATGIGALNEIFELFAVIVAGSTGVGGYFNNALDLIFNLIGSIIGVFIAKKLK
jgi:putative membrane protein